ncbi:MAG TPA: type II toxin-antitoxin system RelE/ParE family toxin [Thermomicrobiales bacterium]|nr:type II toxin-antitoxin system RelE/ParE family toxin [Thermomicrobiales bacterium]
MPSMQAVFYRMSDGSEPVDDVIERLSTARQVAIDEKIGWLNRLQTTDPPLPFPHSSQVTGELRELRCHYGTERYRVFYRRSENLFILLHIIRKNTGALPKAEITIAQERWADFKARMNAAPRTPPRAAGHDAPPERRGTP